MSDHNPQDVETKRLPFAEAAPGAIGIETMLTAGLRLVHSGELALMTPAQGDVDARRPNCSGLPGGTLRPGSPADVIVVDPDVPWVLDPAELKSKCKNTPFDEARCRAAWCAPSSPAARSTNTCDRALALPDDGSMPRCERPCAVFHRHLAGLCRALVFGYLLRLDPVRPDPDAARRHRRHPRRSAPAISAPPMCCAPAARGSPPRRCIGDTLKGTRRGAAGHAYSAPMP